MSTMLRISLLALLSFVGTVVADCAPTPVAGKIYLDNPAGSPRAATIGSPTAVSASAITIPLGTPCICDTLLPQSKPSSSATWTSRTSIATGSASYQFTGLDASTSYDFRFVAGANSQAVNSNTVTASTTGGSIPSPVLSDPVMGTTTASVAFTVAGGYQYQQLIPQYSTDGSTWASIASDLTSPLSYTGLKPSTNYQFRALPGNNETLASNVVTGKTVADNTSAGIVIDRTAGTITINQPSGGLGTKATPQPLVFDDFSTGTNGKAIAGNAPIYRAIGPSWVWADYRAGAAPSPSYSNVIVRPGKTYSSRHQLSNANYNASLEVRLPVMSELLISYWVYHNQIGSADATNFKQLYLYGAGSNDEPSMPWGAGQPGVDSSYRFMMQETGDGAKYQGGTSQDTFIGRWSRVDYYIKESSPNTADGRVTITIARPGASQVQTFDYPNIKTRPGSTHFDQLLIGTYISGSGASSDLYYSDINIDNTQQRVEIADNATWGNRTMSEIQPCTAWSDTKIVCRYNPGAFSKGVTGYVNVINSAGVPTTIGPATIQ